MSKNQSVFLWRYLLQTLGVIFVLAIFVRIFFVTSYVVSGSSMLPSVWPGDFLVASKWRLAEARHGDVVAFRCPQAQERTCLRRVVGLPGDRIEFLEGKLSVNGRQILLKSISEDFAQEALGARHWAVWPDTQSHETRSPVVVPPEHIFLLNDKRADEEDSRSWGAVPTQLIDARVFSVWLSLDWFEKSGDIRMWPRVRWNRVFRRVD